jgi:hypothetical protein
MMPTIKVSVKTPFGEILVSGESPEELLEALGWLNKDFVAGVNDRVSGIIAKQSQDHLKGVIDMRRDGPVIVAPDDLSHYASIGLILYCMKDYQASSKEIKASLTQSGKKVTVPARLHEMRKRGHIFKPMSKGSIYRLSAKGVKWMEEEVIPSLKK